MCLQPCTSLPLSLPPHPPAPLFLSSSMLPTPLSLSLFPSVCVPPTSRSPLSNSGSVSVSYPSLSISLSVYLSLSLPVCLCLSVCLSVRLTPSVSVSLSVSLCLSLSLIWRCEHAMLCVEVFESRITFHSLIHAHMYINDACNFMFIQQ